MLAASGGDGLKQAGSKTRRALYTDGADRTLDMTRLVPLRAPLVNFGHATGKKSHYSLVLNQLTRHTHCKVKLQIAGTTKTNVRDKESMYRIDRKKKQRAGGQDEKCTFESGGEKKKKRKKKHKVGNDA